MRIGKILVPIDFSDRSSAAARHAVALARWFESRLIFVHAIPPAPPEYAGFEGGYYTARFETVNQEAIASLRRQLECVALKAGADSHYIDTLILEGDPARQIVKLAADEQVDLIVMPTHGYGIFRRFVLGSVTAKILHDVDCPVLTGTHVPEIQLAKPRPYRRIACAVDLRERSHKVLRWAADFAASFDAELALIHAAPSLELSGQAGQYAGGEWRGFLIQSAKRETEKLLQETGCRPEVFIDSGDVTRYVPAAAKEYDADLLVIGRSEREGLLGRLRTNAYALIRESPCPVVSV